MADDDDQALMQRLAALEAEVKADADAQTKRKEAAVAKVREQRAAQQADKDELRARQVALVKRKPVVEEPSEPEDDGDNLRGALELAGKANQVKKELSKKGAKSWIKSGLASTAFGPLGWLYAGSMREAIPASAIWLVVATLISKIGLPTFLLMPVLLVVLPLSGIAGIVYALQYNKTGKRQRLFDGDKKKALPEGEPSKKKLTSR